MPARNPFNIERFFQALGEREICVCYLTEILAQPQSKISRHLAYLRAAGIVAARRDGKWMHYRIVMPANLGAAQVLRQTLAWLADERELQADCLRLQKACCSPAKFAGLAAAPRPTALLAEVR